LGPPHPLLEIRRSGLSGLRALAAEEVGEAPARELRDELAVDQRAERPLHVLERREAVETLAALLQLAERLRPTQHERRQQRELGIRKVERLVEEVPVLR